jgi:hypothetical protein
MSSTDNNEKGGWRRRIFREMREYLVIFLYLALMFATFTQYRRLFLATYDIKYTNYGIAVIEAAILAKVVMIGHWFRIGRILEHKPLIYSTVFKSFAFSVFVVLFTLIEHMIKGLWKGEGLTGGLVEFFGRGAHELLAGYLVVFVAFLPFFAFRELERVLGKGKVWDLFFRKRD